MDTMTCYMLNKSWPTPVPAAAVIQGGRALFIFIGRKAYVDCFISCLLKTGNSPFSFQIVHVRTLSIRRALVEFSEER